MSNFELIPVCKQVACGPWTVEQRVTLKATLDYLLESAIEQSNRIWNDKMLVTVESPQKEVYRFDAVTGQWVEVIGNEQTED